MSSTKEKKRTDDSIDPWRQRDPEGRKKEDQVDTDELTESGDGKPNPEDRGRDRG